MLRRGRDTFSVDSVMHKCLYINSLRYPCRIPARRTAFSLAELVVSIGILVLMFSLAGQVFNITVQSTGQATALTEVNQIVRAFERMLREDLRRVQPGRSLMLVQGNPVNAYWTAEGREADDDGDPSAATGDGYPHVADPTREDGDGNMVKPRADMLMIFTARRDSSFIQPIVASNLQQVVYGHAELGVYVPTGDAPPQPMYEFQSPGKPTFPVDTGNDDYPSPDEVSPIPAEQWHLARRNVLLLSSGADLAWANAAARSAIALGLGDPRVLTDDPRIVTGETDVVGNFRYEAAVLHPGFVEPWYLPQIFNDALGAGNTIGGVETPFARSLLDESPPAPIAGRLAHYFVPNCASFKIEWMLDSHSEFVAGRLQGAREVLWIDPGAADPLATIVAAHAAAVGQYRNDLDSLLNERTFHADGKYYSLTDRFGIPTGRADPEAVWDPLAADGRRNLVVFGASQRVPGGRTMPDRIVAEDVFPRALRVTIDVYDDHRRLDRPVRHVMVVAVGG